jgi:hypothetical protein
MSLTSRLRKALKFGIREEHELVILKENITKLTVLLREAKTSRKAELLAKYYQRKVIKEDHHISRIERRLKKLIDKAEDHIPKGKLKPLKDKLETCQANLVDILSNGGKLDTAIKEEENWPKVDSLINQAMGNVKSMGLIQLVETLEAIINLNPDIEQNHQYAFGFRIPPGYIPLEEWKRINKTTKDPPASIMRSFYDLKEKPEGGVHRFVFNDKDHNFLLFREMCRLHTKYLADALQKEFFSQGLKYWVKRTKKPSKYQDYQQISFLIEPLFFKTYISREEKKESRMQTSLSQIITSMHFDQDHNCQVIRLLHLRHRKDTLKDRTVESIKDILRMNLDDKRKDLSKKYGNWEAMAKIIADQLKTADEYANSR